MSGKITAVKISLSIFLFCGFGGKHILRKNMYTVLATIELLHEKTCFLHKRKKRRRSAGW